jgi:PhoPQ-activated pathogenicity-related protein
MASTARSINHLGDMMKALRRALLAALVFFSASAAVSAQQPVGQRTPLDDYIAKPDATYKWELVNKTISSAVTTYVLELTSQTWRAVPEVDRPIWKHYLTIVKPVKVEYDTAFIMIGGGANGGKPPSGASRADLNIMAVQTNSVVMELGQIPNQPLIFDKDGKPRKEDDLIAYCWIKFMDTGDATWLPRLPMVKSVVRAMDAATEFLASAAGGNVSIKHFVVAGGSKRGWTTWLTAAVDPRVVACVPIVIDLVNVQATMRNHYAAYGFWAPAVGDYVAHRVMERSETPAYQELLKIVDPYSYRQRLTMPKFILNAAGDQFFTPDSSRFYFDELVGPKYLRYVPNGDHGLKDTDAFQSLIAFYTAILTKTPIPTITWKMEADGSLRAEASTKPTSVVLWQATNPKARDFRLESIGKAYKPTPLEPDAAGEYRARVSKPPEGWTAYFMEFSFAGPGKTTLKFTTPVQVAPDVLPHSYEEFKKTIKNQ